VRKRPVSTALVLAVLAASCARETAVDAVGRGMPDTIGPFAASGEPTRETTDGRVVYTRRYSARGREASLRLVDVAHAPDVMRAFETTLSFQEDTVDQLARPTVVDGERGVLSWSRETAESSVEVLVARRALLSLNIWPADEKDEAARRFPTAWVDATRQAMETP
jgi:hypothetical protein